MQEPKIIKFTGTMYDLKAIHDLLGKEFVKDVSPNNRTTINSIKIDLLNKDCQDKSLNIKTGDYILVYEDIFEEKIVVHLNEIKLVKLYLEPKLDDCIKREKIIFRQFLAVKLISEDAISFYDYKYSHGDGAGYSNDSGDGYGSGDATMYFHHDSHGNGWGNGDIWGGHGNGYGNGDGYGCGYGNGHSYGGGDGYGCGHGDGYGCGHGDGDK